MLDGGVQAEFDCADVFEGYPHTLHGGVIASLLDGAMTNCLFAHGLIAVAAEVTIRFFRPVATSRTATIRAWLDDSTLTLRRLGAELRQDGEIMTKTAGKFAEWYAPPAEENS
jgi:acyl-coenzyme A thioesterase PaaI-like protein